jgi:hypothetical protein
VRRLKREARLTLTPALQQALRALPYAAFLNTPYWLLVRGLLIRERGRWIPTCENCDIRGSLDVHHLTYAHRGYELFHLEDLRLLCRVCHDIYHGPADIDAEHPMIHLSALITSLAVAAVPSIGRIWSMKN